MNFAPYQSSPPESTRALSPPLRSPTRSPNPSAAHQQQQSKRVQIASIADGHDPWSASRPARLPSPSQFADGSRTPGGYQDIGSGEGGDGEDDRSYFLGRGRRAEEGTGRGGGGGDVFATSLGIKMGVEAALAYLLLPPAGGVILLIFEHGSDYVRFHAWQSALVFTAIFVLHLVFSWTAVLSWMLFALDLLLIGFLSFRAYRDAETLDRIELPFFGKWASHFVDNE